MRLLTFFACGLMWTGSAIAQTADSARSDVWGKAPQGSDDRFSNPKSKLYAGPDGWFNTGEVRGTVSNNAKTPYQYTASFQPISGDFTAVKGLLVLNMKFGSPAVPKPGVYKVGSKGNAAENKVQFSFDDVSDNQLKGWTSEDGAGTLTVSLVNGFTYFTCRNVVLQPTGMSNKGEMKNPLTLGFEGALAPR